MSEDSMYNEEESSNSSSATYPRTNEKELVSDFISSLFEEEKEEQEKKIVINFVDSLFEKEKPKEDKEIKKINNKISKKKIIKNYLPSNTKQKNSAKLKKNNDTIVKDNYQDKTIDTDMYRNSLIKKILNINKQKNNYDRNKSIEIKPNYININDENDSEKKNIKKNNSTKKRIIKKKY